MTIEELVKIDVDERIQREKDRERVDELLKQKEDIDKEISDLTKNTFNFSKAYSLFCEMSEKEYEQRKGERK